jgi:hypothetical protein
MDGRTFWILYEAMGLTARPSHTCVDHDHCFVDCPYTESIESLRVAAVEWCKTLQAADTTGH